jgi:hypothetical protein
MIYWYHLPGSNVVAGHQAIEAVDDLEPLVKFFGWVEGESAAHTFVLIHTKAHSYPSGSC